MPKSKDKASKYRRKSTRTNSPAYAQYGEGKTTEGPAALCFIDRRHKAQV